MTIKMALPNTCIWTSCVHPRWKPRDNSILLFGMWHRIHFIWLTHMDSHLGVEMPKASSSFRDVPIDSTVPSYEKKEWCYCKAPPETCFLSKEASLWNPLRLITTARKSNQIVLFGRLDSTSYWSSRLTYLSKTILMISSYLKLFRAL